MRGWFLSVVVHNPVDYLEGFEKQPPADFCEQVEDDNCANSHHSPSEDVECEAEVWVVGDELHNWFLEGLGLVLYD